MYELPLFPLNTVLFPGMPIRLHIFEERYKKMIGYCYTTGSPFGVVLIDTGEEVGGGAEPVTIGCTAVITEMEPLPGGRMNIVAVGQERFVIRGFKNEQPYLVGEVEPFPMAAPASEQIERSSGPVRAWLTRYLETLAKASESVFDADQLPADPVKLAYMASFLLNIPSEQKQTLLAEERIDMLLEELRQLYRREVTLLDAMLMPAPDDQPGPFSAN